MTDTEVAQSRWQQRERHPRRLTASTVPCRAHRGRVTPKRTVHKPTSHRYHGSKTSHVHLPRRDCPVNFGDDQKWRACSCGQLKTGCTDAEVAAWWDRHRRGLSDAELPEETKPRKVLRSWRGKLTSLRTAAAQATVTIRTTLADSSTVQKPSISGIKCRIASASSSVRFALDVLRCLRPHGHVEVANSTNQFGRRCLDPAKGFALRGNARTVAFENRAGERIELIRTRRTGQAGWVAVTGDKFDGRFFPTVSGGAGVDLFLITGGGAWNANNWATTSNQAVGTATPTNADRCILDSHSGNITTTSGALCQSINCGVGTNYAGSVTGSTNITFSSNVAPVGGVAMNLRGTWSTYTGVFTLTGTQGGGTVTVATNGVSLAAAITSNSSFTLKFLDQVTSTGALNKSIGGTGTIDLNGQTTQFSTLGISTGIVDFNASAGTGGVMTVTGTTVTVSPTTLTARTGELKMTGAGTVTFTATGKSFYKVTYDVSASALKTNILSIAGDLTWTNVFSVGGNAVAGNNANRPIMQSSVLGTARTLTGTGGTFTMTGDADFMDITVSGSPTFSNGSSCFVGDAQGNSTYLTCSTDGGTNGTARTTQTSTGTASFTWSTHGWTSRVPLPQDDVSIPNAFVAGRTITADMPRLGQSITCTCTGNPIFNFNVAQSVFGSITLATGMTTSGTVVVTLAGRSTYTVTSNSVTWTNTLLLGAPSGTYTLADAITLNRTGANFFNIQSGTFVDSGVTVTGSGANGTFTQSGGTVTMTGTWNLANASATTFWNQTGGTTTGTGSTITLTAAAAGTRTFAGGGQTYGTLTYTVAGSTGQLAITGSNTFSAINFSDATNGRTLSLANGTTTTCPNWSGVFGRSGANVTLTGGTGATIATTGGATMAFVTADHITATPAGAVYVLDGVDGGSNAGIVFDPPDELPQDVTVQGRGFVPRQAVSRAGRW